MSANLDARLAQFREWVTAKSVAGDSAADAAASREVIQLPLWPERVRAVPNGFLRSALFGVFGRGARRYLKREKVAAVGGVDVIYTGEQLGQDDLDVYINVLHAVRTQELGRRCRITSYALLKALGKRDGGRNRANLHAHIIRLVAGAVEIRLGHRVYIGSLVVSAAQDELTREWVIELDPRLAVLFASDQFTQIQWAVRQALAGQPLARWLHGFYSSHAAPYPLRIATLHQLCGSRTAEVWRFTQTLRKALDAVARASKRHGERFSYIIRGGLVTVTRGRDRAGRRLPSKEIFDGQKLSTGSSSKHAAIPCARVGDTVLTGRSYRADG